MTTPPEDEEIARIRERRAKIAPGEWKAFQVAQRDADVYEVGWLHGFAKVFGNEPASHMDFIANAPTDIDTLFAALTTAHRERDAARKVAFHEALERNKAARERDEIEAKTIASLDWKPIETAPKDGTPIFVYSENWLPARAAVTWWVLNLLTGKKGGHMDAPLVKDGWTDGKGNRAGFEPTHWLPIRALTEKKS